MGTEYDKTQIIENDKGWIFYDAAIKCWKHIYNNLAGNSILDVGCGGGVSVALIKLFNPFLYVEGLEGADSGNEIWKMRNVKITVGDIYHLPFPDNSFDTVYSSHVLEHCEKPEEIISETIRVARHRIIHVVPDGNVNEKNFGSPHLHIFNRKNYTQLFNRLSLQIVTFQSIQDNHMNSLIMVCNVNK